MQARYLSLFVSALALTAAAHAFAQGQDVQSQGDTPEPLVPIYMEIEGVKGESTSPPPPPPPPPPQAPPAEHGVQAPPQEMNGLLLPAVQGPPHSPPPPPPPQTPPAQRGVQAPPQEGGTGLLLPAVQKAQDPPAEEEAERPRRRGFSLSIGGVTIGSGGVSVGVGDVTGDARDGAESGERRTRRRGP